MVVIVLVLSCWLKMLSLVSRDGSCEGDRRQRCQEIAGEVIGERERGHFLSPSSYSGTGRYAGGAASSRANLRAGAREDDARRPWPELRLTVRILAAEPTFRSRTAAPGGIATEGGVPGGQQAEAAGITGVASDFPPQ
jgi:hypothetical protein